MLRYPDDPTRPQDPRKLYTLPDALRNVPEPLRYNQPGPLGSVLGWLDEKERERNLRTRQMTDEAAGIEVPFDPDVPSISPREVGPFERALDLLPENVASALRPLTRPAQRGPLAGIQRVAQYATSPEFLADLETGGLSSVARAASLPFRPKGEKIMRGARGVRAATEAAREGLELGPDVDEALRALNLVDATDEVLRAQSLGATVQRRGKKSGSLERLWSDVGSREEAYEMALRGDHLVPQKGGGFLGGPKNVRNMEDLYAQRERALESLAIGLRNWDWYLRARRSIGDVAGFTPGMATTSEEGVRASQMARASSPFSEQASPETELGLFLRFHNQRMLGQTPVVGTRDRTKRAGASYVEDPSGLGYLFAPENVSLGRKTGAYADAKDLTVDYDELFHSVNDRWHGRAFGFDKDSFSGTDHSYMVGETIALADEAQRRGIGLGMLPEGFVWDPNSVQAAIWAGERFKSYKQAQLDQIAAGTLKGPPRTDEQLMMEAMSGLDDYMRKHATDDTFEFITGLNTGHLQGLSSAPYELRQRYTDEMSGAYMASPSGQLRDPVYDAFDIYQMPAQRAQGMYINSAGEVERNPLVNILPITSQSRTPSGKSWMVEPSEERLVQSNALLRGLIFPQENVAYNTFSPAISTAKAEDLNAARYIGPDLDEAQRAFESRGLYAVQVHDALHVFPDPERIDPLNVQNAVQDALASGLKGEAIPGYVSSGYEGISWTPEQGTGQATRSVFERIENNLRDVPNALERIDQGRMRQTMDIVNQIDRRIADENNFPVREDLIKLREMIRDVGVAGVMRYIKETGGAGLPVAAALIPSLAYLLEEQREPPR